MATCNINSLLASGREFSMLLGGLSQVARLALLKQIAASGNPNADLSVNGLLERGKCFTCLTPGQQRIVKLQLLCNILSAEPAPPTCDCTIPEITNLEQVSDGPPYVVRVTWTFTTECEGGHFEIWISVDGGDFAFYEEAPQGDTTFQNNGNHPPGATGQIVSYQMRYVNGDSVCEFSSPPAGIELAPI